MTFNIRYDNSNDGINQWENRKSEVIDLIKYYEPDALGIQEGLFNQVKYLDQNLSNYSWIGCGRDDGKQKGEFSAIYFNHNKLSLIEASTFWLSNTSDEVSIGWDASMERVCTYGVFENKISKKKILILNTHYDHIGKRARLESSKLILGKIKEINQSNYPIILMGDFNSQPKDEPIQEILPELNDPSELSKNGIYGPVGTFTGFEENKVAERRIDYIFTKDLEAVKYRHVDDKMKNNNYVSDHLPVLIEIKL